MVQQILKYARQLLTVKQQTEKNSEAIEEIQREVRQLTEIVRTLAHAVQRNHENESHERKNSFFGWRIRFSKANDYLRLR